MRRVNKARVGTQSGSKSRPIADALGASCGGGRALGVGNGVAACGTGGLSHWMMKIRRTKRYKCRFVGAGGKM